MTLDHQARARVARGWLNSSLDQATYAAQHGVSARTLRDWVYRYGAGRRPQAQLRAAIVASIEQLQNVLSALDAEAAVVSAAAAEHTQEAARHASSEAPVTPPRATPVSPIAGPLASSTTRDAHPAAGARSAAPAGDNEATGEEPEVLEVPAPATAAVVAGTDGAPVPSWPAGRAVSQSDRRLPRGDTAAGVVDLDDLRNRAAQRRATRAASGTPRRNPFLDWDVE